MSSPIEHLVVLMFENRSFDSLLGRYRPERYDGLTGAESNPAMDGTKLTVQPLGGTAGYVTKPDPHHEHEDAMVHLFGDATIQSGNQGFAAQYQRTASKDPLDPATARQVMGVFDTASQLPALATLVDHFRVADAWFSSLPGPTWPNRFFAHCATSGGLWRSPTDFSSVWSEVGSVFNMPTIFENMSAANRPWNVYYHDIPQALALARLHHYRSRFKHFSSFVQDCATGGLPNYSFIEPGFFDSKVLRLAASDMHPPHDVRHGDVLIASVYNALRANEAVWRKSMLIVLADEHGGYYDHVAPGKAVPPDAISQADPGFQFDRLGVRVPAVIVSPWVAKGSVDKTVYDHASIPATLKNLFSLPAFLTARDARAATFDRDLVAAPRSDAPISISSVDTSGIALRDEDDLHVHHQGLLSMVSRLQIPGQLPPGEQDREAAILHVARYLDV